MSATIMLGALRAVQPLALLSHSNSGDDRLMIFFFFFFFFFHVSQEIRSDILCESLETICMKCQVLVSGRKKEENYFNADHSRYIFS